MFYHRILFAYKMVRFIRYSGILIHFGEQFIFHALYYSSSQNLEINAGRFIGVRVATCNIILRYNTILYYIYFKNRIIRGCGQTDYNRPARIFRCWGFFFIIFLFLIHPLFGLYFDENHEYINIKYFLPNSHV